MAAISVDTLRKTFGRGAGVVTALDDVSFDVGDGEFFCLLGPSGAGKTTTLKSIAGLVEPDKGAVRIGGQDVADVEPTHRNLAMCFESYALYPQHNVFDNMASPLRSPRLRMPAADVRSRVGRIADMLGIGHLLDRSVTQLSNGQRQRVALGRVLVRPAHAYLLDEPLAHLDAKLRATMRAELKAISTDGLTTTVYVTHDYVEALSLADRIGVLREGRILQVGTPREMWASPANAFVAQAFGKPRINMLAGGLRTSRDHASTSESASSGLGRSAPRDGTHAFVAGGVEIPLRDIDAPPGESVQLAVRPRDLRLHVGAGDPPPGKVRLDGVVYVLEHLGRQTEVTVQIGESLVSVVAPRAAVPTLALDDKVGVLIDPSTTHVFLSGEEGKRVSP
ncbi:MAG: ATP-binding cassette domain-containing protein [Micromonosporaceae bacterium]|nr:ATP-binding cassette domain-containing protein [Micromonosporaceae bacterium]